MKLVLYSGGQNSSNQRLHQALVDLAQERRQTRRPLQMTYFPFCADGSSAFFSRIARRYRNFGVSKFLSLSADASPSKEEIKRAFQSDIIYLAGGNTFYFLKHLQAAGLMRPLLNFVKKGGVLAGLSAGGLIMSPTIKLAADRGLGPDPNEVKLKNLTGLGLFPFEFSPHFSGTQREIRAHQNYSRKTEFPVFAVKDGSGIVIRKNEIQTVGSATLFIKGKRFDLKRNTIVDLNQYCDSTPSV